MEEKKRRLDMQAELEVTKENLRKTQKSFQQFKSKHGGIESEIKAPEEEKAPKEPVKKEQTHVWDPTIAHCTDCGEKNPDFKDETECSNCKHQLGAIATIKQVKHCPGCGKTNNLGEPGYDEDWKARRKRTD